MRVAVQVGNACALLCNICTIGLFYLTVLGRPKESEKYCLGISSQDGNKHCLNTGIIGVRFSQFVASERTFEQ